MVSKRGGDEELFECLVLLCEVVNTQGKRRFFIVLTCAACDAQKVSM